MNSGENTELPSGIVDAMTNLSGDSDLNAISRRIIPASFRPAWWLPGAHLQTVWPALMPRRWRVPIRRRRFELPDGDFIDVDWAGEQGPIVVVLHGLGGSSASHYVRGMLQALALQGWRAALMHFRGCSGEPNRLPRGYHAGETGDLNTFIAMLRRSEPCTPLAVIGYSLGGNVVLKWLGEQGSEAPVSAAVAVSVPFDLANAAARVHRGFSRVYERRMLRSLQELMIRKGAQQALPWGDRTISAISSLREFDDRITAPLHGFHGADDYYARAGCRPYLSAIVTPTLVIHALNDPFMSPTVVPGERELSAAISLELSNYGGHVGFVGGEPWAPHYWLETRIPAYLATRFASDPLPNAQVVSVPA
jgi:predicted alpha/beta-fold hydrolase